MKSSSTRALGKTRPPHLTLSICLTLFSFSILLYTTLHENHNGENDDNTNAATVDELSDHVERLSRQIATLSTQSSRASSSSSFSNVPSAMPGLIFYNRPPKTGSTTVREAMHTALVARNLTYANCFQMTEWNEMGLRTLINRDPVSFYSCHTRLFRDRYHDVSQMRGGNVTFITSTRPADRIILSAYMQANRGRKIAGITGQQEMEEELVRYKEFVEDYPVNALYKFHGIETPPLTTCPPKWLHESAMRQVAERYEVVIDLEHPEESAAMVEIVTGLKPDFDLMTNVRTLNSDSEMIKMLEKVDTSHKSCGNELVHKVLQQQFNVIKDRIMRNRCFNEADGTFEECLKADLSTVI